MAPGRDADGPDARIDRAAPVRAGEEVDAESLGAYLRAQGLSAGDLPQVAQFPRGFSNLTYLVTSGGEQWILRRPPFGVGKGVAHDVVREARLLAALRGAFPLVPRVVAICDDPTIIGAPFFLMERATGIVLREAAPPGLALDASLMHRISGAAIDTLAAIHAVDVHAAGLDTLGRPEGYTRRQVEGWRRRYDAARTGAQPEVERIADWLAQHVPVECGATLVHNDFKYDNLVLAPDDPARVVAVLDWEMATVGDPLMDLGTTLAYWVEADDAPAIRALGLGVTALPGNLTRTQVVDRYAAATGRGVHDAVFYYVFGLFKVAVIAQQIFARFAKGMTDDRRFARLDQAVTALGVAGSQALDRGRIGAGG